MSLESSLWSWLSNVRHVMRENIHLTRVENMIGAGFPDVDGFAGLGRDRFSFKLELKSSPRPARPATPVRFKLKGREKQIEFCRRRYLMGDNVYFLLQIGEGAERRVYLAPGDVGAELQRGVTESQAAILCLNGGLVFHPKATPSEVIEGIRTCSKRRHSLP